MYAQFVVARGVTVAPTGYFFLSHEALQGNMKRLLQIDGDRGNDEVSETQKKRDRTRENNKDRKIGECSLRSLNFKKGLKDVVSSGGFGFATSKRTVLTLSFGGSPRSGCESPAFFFFCLLRASETEASHGTLSPPLCGTQVDTVDTIGWRTRYHVGHTPSSPPAPSTSDATRTENRHTPEQIMMVIKKWI